MLTPESQKGMVGLINLGNTCYINSTLQCLSNTVDLTKYFLMQYFRNDINTGNKLGSSGNIAFKYYKLLSNMWCNFENKIDPSEFVNAFKNLKKQFGGSRQQDAQEFLSVLLDQLHEDLNRITDKPYIELLEKQPNEDDLTASKRWWDLHRKREDRRRRVKDGGIYIEKEKIVLLLIYLMGNLNQKLFAKYVENHQ